MTALATKSVFGSLWTRERDATLAAVVRSGLKDGAVRWYVLAYSTAFETGETAMSCVEIAGQIGQKRATAFRRQADLVALGCIRRGDDGVLRLIPVSQWCDPPGRTVETPSRTIETAPRPLPMPSPARVENTVVINTLDKTTTTQPQREITAALCKRAVPEKHALRLARTTPPAAAHEAIAAADAYCEQNRDRIVNQTGVYIRAVAARWKLNRPARRPVIANSCRPVSRPVPIRTPVAVLDAFAAEHDAAVALAAYRAANSPPGRSQRAGENGVTHER